MRPFLVYCSGSIAKAGVKSGSAFWTDVERDLVRTGAGPDSVIFLNPDDPMTDMSDSITLFGRDMLQVAIADAAIVDGRERRGIGIGVEMAVAADFSTSVLTVAPPETQYRASNVKVRGSLVADYTHPHVAGLSLDVVPGFLEAGEALRLIDRSSNMPTAAGASTLVGAAIDRYRAKLLPLDGPMQDLIQLIRSLDSDLGMGLL